VRNTFMSFRLWTSPLAFVAIDAGRQALADQGRGDRIFL
jgi:hypothetical protein